MPADLAEDALSILLATGRTVPPRRWVSAFVDRTARETCASLPHNVLKGFYEREAD